MNLIALFFICLRMYSFMRAEEIAYFIQTFSNILKSRRENPKQKQIIYMDKTGMQFIIYLLMDISSTKSRENYPLARSICEQ